MHPIDTEEKSRIVQNLPLTQFIDLQNPMILSGSEIKPRSCIPPPPPPPAFIRSIYDSMS